MAHLLVRSVGFDDLVVSKHPDTAAAEKAMRRKGVDPGALVTNGYRIVDASTVEVIEVFGKRMTRPKAR